MGVYAVYFSATGNTEKSVKAMAGTIHPEYQVYDCTCYKESSGLNKYISTDVDVTFAEDDFVIAADGGLAHTKKLGITPDWDKLRYYMLLDELF